MGRKTAVFDITVTGTSTPYTYLWSNGATTEDLNNTAANTYTVTVAGANGCTAELTADVPENTISFNIQGTPAANTSCAINNGAVDLEVTPVGTYTFVWSNGETTEDIQRPRRGQLQRGRFRRGRLYGISQFYCAEYYGRPRHFTTDNRLCMWRKQWND